MNESLSRQKLEQSLAQLTDRTLSRGERYGHVVLVLFAAAMAACVFWLLVSEPGLPLRTKLAFALLVAIAVAWVVFALRVLFLRQPLLANREVIGARMAVTFSVLFTAGTIIVGLATSGIALTPAAWLGVTMSIVALALLVRAIRRRATLQGLRDRLERELADAS